MILEFLAVPIQYEKIEKTKRLRFMLQYYAGIDRTGFFIDECEILPVLTDGWISKKCIDNIGVLLNFKARLETKLHGKYYQLQLTILNIIEDETETFNRTTVQNSSRSTNGGRSIAPGKDTNDLPVFGS